MRIVPNWLKQTPIAHRGLWGGEIAENSISAYKNAVKHGFAIEIDLYQTTDGELVSFHDETLDRTTNGTGFIYEKSFSELKNLTLKGTENEKIPTFNEVLSIAEGKVPLLIELKNQPSKDFVENVIKRLKNYSGEFATQSFNPKYIGKIKKLAPEFIRGILGNHTAKEQPLFKRFIIKRLPLNFAIKPDFISYNFTALPLKKRKVKNKVVLAWTITSPASAEKIKPFCDNIIFEHFIP